MAKAQPHRKKHVPQRTCIACRKKTDKRRLTRIVQTAEMSIVIDSTGKKNGRGAYICDQEACREKILSTQLLNKAFKTEVSKDEKATIAKQLAQSLGSEKHG